MRTRTVCVLVLLATYMKNWDFGGTHSSSSTQLREPHSSFLPLRRLASSAVRSLLPAAQLPAAQDTCPQSSVHKQPPSSAPTPPPSLARTPALLVPPVALGLRLERGRAGLSPWPLLRVDQKAEGTQEDEGVASHWGPWCHHQLLCKVTSVPQLPPLGIGDNNAACLTGIRPIV